MIKLTSKDKDLLLTILAGALNFAVMLAVMHFIGQLNGVTVIAVMIVLQAGFLTRRVAVLERELRAARDSSDGAHSKVIEKTA